MVGLAQSPKLLSNSNKSLEAGAIIRSWKSLCLFYICPQFMFHEAPWKCKIVL